MLQHLFIKDFAIVSQAQIHVGAGMTVITGETGAGKSILIDAISLALGGRADSQMIRPGCERAEIAAVFDISGVPDAVLWLADLELTQDEDLKQCIIRRLIYPQGRSRAFINSRPVTTSQLKLLGEYLLQIHGQHQHQSLLKSQEQLRLLDAFGQHEILVSQVRTAFDDCEKLQQRRQALIDANQGNEAKRDLLQYQWEEFQTLALSEQEVDTLHGEHDKLSHANEFIEMANQLLELIEQQDGNALQIVGAALQQLRPFADKVKSLSNARTCLDNAAIQLKEAVSEIQDFVQNVDLDPRQLATIERRLTQIHDIARKHKVEPQQLFAHGQRLQNKLSSFASLQADLEQIDKDFILAKQQYQQVAKKLSIARKKAVDKLATEATTCIQSLAMPDALFTIFIHAHPEHEVHPSGNESIQFAISANAGHAPQPLTKVASGGELSRISLALELILAKYMATPCLIFDEVDVGISGKVGAIVGKALYDLSKMAQVLCITHLPQVAALGDHHLQVSKNRVGSETISEILLLNEAERVDSIARMLGGIDISAQAKANAKQLLKREKALT